MSSDTPEGGPPVASSSGGSCAGYSVEARVDGRPREIAGQLFDGEWRRVTFVEVPAGLGVPARGHQAHTLAPHGLMNYAGAQALRWWFVAADAPLPLVRTRLMRHEVRYSTSATVIGPVDEVDDVFPPAPPTVRRVA